MNKKIPPNEKYILDYSSGEKHDGYILYPHEIMNAESGMTYGGKSTPVTDWYLKAIPAAINASGVLDVTNDAFEVYFEATGVCVHAGTFRKLMDYHSEECPEVIREHYYELSKRFEGMFPARAYSSLYCILCHTEGTCADARALNELWNKGESQFVIDYVSFLANQFAEGIKKKFCQRDFEIFKAELSA